MPLRACITLIWFLSSTSLAIAQNDGSETATKVEATCKNFVEHWLTRDYESAAKLTSELIFHSNGHSTSRIESRIKKIEFLTRLREFSDVGDAKNIGTRFVKIESASKLPFDKMGFVDADARKLFRELVDPDDYFAAVLIEPPDSTKRDALILVCRKFDSTFKVVGLLYSEPHKCK